jgi:hypothetical protein
VTLAATRTTNDGGRVFVKPGLSSANANANKEPGT